jgi:hypothetical protein
VVVADGYNMTCTQRIRGLEVTLGNYTLTDDFYVMDLADTHVVLGVQWLYSLGDIHMNYQGHEDGVLGQGWTTSHPKRYVDRCPQDHV